MHENAPLGMPFPMISFFAGVQIFRFWPKTIDYSKAFRSLFTLIYKTPHCKVLGEGGKLNLKLYIDSRAPYLSEVKLDAEVMTSSCVCTRTGILRQPGDLSTRASSFMVSCRTLGGHMSILVTTTKTGTLRARARPRCSEWRGRGEEWRHT